jgi:hypothetical protein
MLRFATCRAGYKGAGAALAKRRSLRMSRRAAVAEGSRRRFTGVTTMGVGVVLVAAQIQLMGRRTCPNDGVVAAVPPGILLTFKQVKVLWRRLSRSDRGNQAEHQRAGS